METIRRTISICLSVIVVLLISCNKENDTDVIIPPVDTISTSDSVLSISGYVLDNSSQPAQGITVALDEMFRSTDQSGYFKFDSLQKGVHILTVNHNFANPDIICYTDTILLTSRAIVNDSVVLLQALVLNEPIDLQPSSITLTWTNNNPDQANFLEYKLFIGGTYYANTLNEENGTLVHIGTSIYDTLYNINKDNYENAGGTITPETEFYFRVYAYNNHEIVSASNILKVVTPPSDTSNLILHYQLQPVINFAAAAPMKGIDWDNNGNLWLFYFEELGYNNGIIEADAKLVNYNYNSGESLDTIVIDGFTNEPAGIAFDDEKIWVQMNLSEGRLNSYNIASGEIINTFMLSEGRDRITDIAKTDEGFIILWQFHLYELINEAGGVLKHKDTPNMMYNASVWDLGIAYRPGEYWLIGSNDEKISIMDENGVLLGIVNTGLNLNLSWGSDCRLAIKDNKLALATSSQVYIFEIVPQ